MKSPLMPLYNILLGAACLSVSAVLIIQVFRIAGRFFGVHLPGADAYAGYFLAAGAFLALPATLRQGEHIRVTLLLERLPSRARYLVELGCLLFAIGVIGYFAFYSWRMAWYSYAFNQVSLDSDRTALWIPQLAMAIGIGAFLIAFFEELVWAVRHRSIAQPEQADINPPG